MADVVLRPAEADEAIPEAAEEIRGPPHFALLLSAIVVLGIAIRVVYTMKFAPHDRLFTDSRWYHLQSLNLRSGRGYLDVSQMLGLRAGPDGVRDTAYWPPLYPGYLAGVHVLLGDAVRTSQLAGAVCGAGTIALTGILGRAVAGRAIGLLAALLVAVCPYLIAVDGSLLSETLYVPFVMLALILAQRARTRPTFPAWCALGAAIGLAALTRGDALFLVLVAGIPAAILSRVPARTIVPRALLGLGATALVLAPWVVRNAIEVGDPTISTISTNGVLAAANCDATYHGDHLGYWSYGCMRIDRAHRLSEATYADRLRDRGVSYALNHVDRWPVVVSARVARVWGIWDPDEQTTRETRETRNLSWQRMTWPVSLATLAVGLVGFWLLARRKRPIAVLVAPVAMATLVAVTSYGNSRFRAAAEPVLLIGVAAALLAALARLRRPTIDLTSG
jgi:4-amino-4-deoxy-L-arabinose transferase-like glycosyltransferase